MQISAVTFDVGGTLIEPWPSVGQVYGEIAARHGVRNLPAELLNDRFKSAWRSQKDFAYTREAWADLVDQTFRGLCIQAPSKTFFAELYDHFAQVTAWRVFDDVVPVLEQLATQDVRLGIISNWDERLRVLLRRLRLDNYFEVIAVSCEVGFPKPSPVIFEHAAEKLGVPPGTVLHVGDSFDLDVSGAKAAGFQALRIRRSGVPATGDEIHSLSALVSRMATP
jgi:putative hydrolase of the HAD superfamily